MSPRPLKVDQALGVLPETDELAPLRDALIGASREDAERAWAASEAYATLDTRLADPEALEAQVPALAERVRERVEAVLRHSVRVLRAVQEGDYAEAARALVSAGEVEEGERRLEQAEEFYRKALELGRKPRDRRAEGLALRRLGRVAREKGELERAIELYRRGYDIAESLRDVEGMIVASQGVGNVYVDQGLWGTAREWYQRGLSLADPDTPSRALWELYNNLAITDFRLGSMETSTALLDQAAAVVRALDDPQGTFFVANARGRLHMARENFREAERSFREALAAARTLSSRGIALLNLSESLLRQSRLAEAERVARELETVAVIHQIVSLLPDAYRMLGTVARARGDAEAFLFYEQALDLCRQRNVPLFELATTQHEYALLDITEGRSESAVARLQEALALYERLGIRSERDRARADLGRIERQFPPGYPTNETIQEQ